MSRKEAAPLEGGKDGKAQALLDDDLTRAAHCGFVDLARKRLEQGASVSAKVNGEPLLLSVVGKIPFLVGERKEETKEIFELLLSFGVNVNQCNKKGERALHLASVWGQADVVKRLLEQGAEVNAVDEEGDTAAHLASFNGANDLIQEATLEIIRELGAFGANFRALNRKGQTPIERARLPSGDEAAQQMERIEAARERRSIAEGLPTGLKERKSSL